MSRWGCETGAGDVRRLAGGRVSQALDEVRYGERIGRAVPVGGETAPKALQKVAFKHLREPDLERALDATGPAPGGMPSFGGFVIDRDGACRRWLGLD